MKLKSKKTALTGSLPLAVCALLSANTSAAATVIPVEEDVMTSVFFQGTNKVRGYAAENNRPVMRVSNHNTNGTTGPATIYLTSHYDFSSFAGPVSAILTLQSAEGGFGADAGAGNPFTVSAHGVNADPLASITDDTNPAGAIDWLSFYGNNILAADSAASTAVNCTDCAVTFDVSALVNDWISGANTLHTIALTGKNDTSGNDFLHGFLNNNTGGAAMGYTYLSVSAVPEPEHYALLLAGLGALGLRLRRGQPA